MRRQREFLKKLAEQKRLSHAYLFSGNDIQGKEELAADLIKTLGVDSADYASIVPDTLGRNPEISIEQIRVLSSFVSMSAWSSPYKAVKLSPADAMSREAQSALLKLLEEPKGNTIFFLLAESPDALLETIRSRAQEFRFFAFADRAAAPEDTQEFQKLREADLIVRFAYAKKLVDSPEQVLPHVRQWMDSARHALRAAVKENSAAVSPLVRLLEILQETSDLLRTSNINPRIALERILLNF